MEVRLSDEATGEPEEKAMVESLYPTGEVRSLQLVSGAGANGMERDLRSGTMVGTVRKGYLPTAMERDERFCPIGQEHNI